MRCPCKDCLHKDSIKCMKARLKPGYYGDGEWIDAGAPGKCYCTCHKKISDKEYKQFIQAEYVEPDPLLEKAEKLWWNMYYGPLERWGPGPASKMELAEACVRRKALYQEFAKRGIPRDIALEAQKNIIRYRVK